MKTEWMGRYRPLVAALVQHGNAAARSQSIRRELPEGIVLNSQEWQVLEYIVEHENDDDCMLYISERLSIPQSTFSKAVKVLCSQKLIAKYQMIDNKKNIILKPTARGFEVYGIRAARTYERTFKPFFEALESLDDATLDTVVHAINILNGNVGKSDAPKELIRIE